MDSAIIVGILSLFGTLIGSITGILTANKLTTYRIGQLEIKVDKHNNVIERFILLEQDNKTQWKKIDELKEQLDKLRRE